MNIFPLIHFSAFLVYIYLMIFIIWQNPKGWLNRAFSILFALLAVWSFSFMFVHNLYVSEETASLFMKIASIGWLGDVPALIWVAFIFMKRKIHKWMIIVLMVIPVIVFSYYIWTDKLISGFSKQYYGWGLSYYTDSPIFWIWGVYYSALVGVLLLLLVDFLKKEPKGIKKKQTWIIFISSLPAAAVASTIDVIFPVMKFHLIPDLADIVFLVWASFIIYAIVRYKFLILTPEMAAEDILATMADSLILVSPDGKIISANQYTLDLLNYDKGELDGKPVKTLFYEKEDNPFTGNNLMEMTAKGYLRDLEVNYNAKDGTMIPMSFSGSILRDKEEKLVGVVCIARDIREMIRLGLKEMELAITEAEARTEHKKGLELQAAYRDLESTQSMLVQSEKLRALGQLGADVAHELNNPLAAVLCRIKKYENKSNEKSEEIDDIKEMKEGLEFMARIIKDLSDFTRESSSEFAEVDCNNIIYSTLGFVTNQINQSDIKIERSLEPDIPFVRGNKRQLQQVIINIINNARDAIVKGGVIKVSTRKIESQKGRFVEMEIEDNGSGMDDEVKNKIFDHFFTTKRPGGGVGLGLSIVHSILKSHRGEIRVKSKKGNGSIFTIRLPAVE